MPLYGDRVTTGDGVVRTSDHTQRDYQEFLKRWDEKLGRELTDAELAQRQHVANLGTSHHPPSDFEMEQERRRDNQRIEARQREREAREREERERKAKLAAFELEERLEEDSRIRLGLEPVRPTWDLVGVTRRMQK